MPNRPATNTLDPDGLCDECGKRHLDRHGNVSCAGHVRFNSDPQSPDYRKRLPEPRPCQRNATPGLDRCYNHGGGSKAAQAAGRRRVDEAKIEAVARKLIPDVTDRTAITNPLETLLELASEANAFRESLRLMANELDGKIRYTASGASGEQLRAEVATYRQALKDTTDLLVAIARLDIEKLLARIESRKVEMTIEALQYGCEQAGLDDDQKRTVMAGVARHLRSVRRPAA